MRIAVALIALVVGGLISATLQADIPDKYQTIVDRNSFGLNPPPPPPEETNNAPLPPINVKLTGFATIGGQKKAYFTVPPKDPAKEPQQYLGLAEGERQDVLEVITIADQEGEVRVRNSGVEMVLSLKNNAFKAATIAPGVTVAPTQGGAPPGGGASPVFNPAASAAVVSDYAKMAQPNQNQNPNQNPNPNPGQPQQQQPGQPNPPPPESGMRSIPTRTLRLSPQPGSPQSSVRPVRDSLIYACTPTADSARKESRFLTV